ncbi:10747_t:CDS:2, partial [Gigaspora margarita]
MYLTVLGSGAILQEALNNNTDKNAASKRKVDPESLQEDTNKQSLTLTETIIQNSKRFKEDSTVSAQQSTESTILLLKDEQPISKPKNKDIYSSQWVVTRNEAEASQKPILSPKNKVKPTQFITLWDLPKEARISQIKRCLNRYGRTSIIEWQENKNTKAAYIKLEYRSEKERSILENSWSIHYDAGRLCRITLRCFNKEALIERNRFKAKITNIPNHTPETALLQQLKSHKVETLHIPLNSNNNQSSVAWLYFNSQVDLENSTNKYKNIGARKNSLRGSLSDKTNASSSTQRITEVGKQTYSLFSSEKRSRSDSRSSSKERSRPNKSVNLGSKAKYTGKENISQTDLLQEILKYPRRRCPHAPNGAPVKSMNINKTKLPASTLIQNIPYHYGTQSRNSNIRLSNIQSEHLAFNNHNNINNTPSYQD